MKMNQLVRVLVVDDSAYVRKVVKQMLNRSPFIEVVGIAHDGEEALMMVEQLKPDVVTLDLIMPNMDGLTFLQKQMQSHPVPVVIISMTKESGELALSALDAGAVDFVQKPTALATEKMFEMAEELIQKIRSAATVKMTHLPSVSKQQQVETQPPLVRSPRTGVVDIVVIGISTGGPQALSFLIPQFPADFPVPIAIVLHMPIGYTELYARRLNEISQLKVIEAHEGDLLQPGVALLAPAGRHLSFRRLPDGTAIAHLNVRPLDTLHRPSVDVLFQSVAEVFGDRSLGVVMTGMGEDGKQGAAWIKSRGGLIFTEAEESCVVYGMPRSVFEAGLSDRVVPLNQMGQAIMEIL